MRKAWKIAVSLAAVVIILTLISLLVIAPNTLADRFISCSVDLFYSIGPGTLTMKIVYTNGSVIPMCFVGFDVHVTNSYFTSVRVHYNGFEQGVLIYNRTVFNAADVVNNKPFLVWGIFYSNELKEFHWNNDYYECYAAHMGWSNITEVVPAGTYYHTMGYNIGNIGWYGQNCFTREPVSPGTYYIYAVAYGKVCDTPANLTVTEILWK